MAKRERITETKSSYFAEDKKNYSFVSSGCTLLDCALGGGFPLGRIVNIVGDKSTSKTALATEAIINFVRAYPDGSPAYRDTEAAFDQEYAEAMGLNLERVDFGDEDKPVITVEDFARDFEEFLNNRIKTNSAGVYVLDSLDALSDDTEMSQDIGKGTYGMAKAKTMSILLRKLVRKVERTKVLLIVISQVRENIGVSFGDKYRRSGGKALDFYASQILFLAHLGFLKKEINKVKRPYGIEIRSKVKKNKVGLVGRECNFQFIFGYGIEDLGASVEWLKEVGRLKDVDIAQTQVKDYLKELESLTPKDYNTENTRIAKVVRKVWREIEVSFLPKRAKYA